MLYAAPRIVEQGASGACGAVVSPGKREGPTSWSPRDAGGEPWPVPTGLTGLHDRGNQLDCGLRVWPIKAMRCLPMAAYHGAARSVRGSIVRSMRGSGHLMTSSGNVDSEKSRPGGKADSRTVEKS
jgi:hypothetical protein